MRRKIVDPDAEPLVKGFRFRRDDVEDWEQYPFSLPAIKDFDYLALHQQVTFLIGENGSGKSTLIEAMAGSLGMNPEGGGRNNQFATNDTHSDLADFLSPHRGATRPRDTFFMRAESMYNFANYLEQLSLIDPGSYRPYGGKSLHKQSHGEAFLALLKNRFGPNGFYILDEPESALSPMRQLGMLRILHDRVKERAQFLIATHSPIIMAYPHATIYSLDEGKLKQVNYEDLEHVQLTRSFLNKPERFLKTLFED